jgi:hypothetical protein
VFITCSTPWSKPGAGEALDLLAASRRFDRLPTDIKGRVLLARIPSEALFARGVAG